MKKWVFVITIINIFFLNACTETNSEKTQTGKTVAAASEKTPSHLIKGEELFHVRCSSCHGEKARGTERGPSFINKIYEPNHHGDASFHLAVRNGVRAHHWKFGNMPKIHGVSQEQVDHIIGYVRWLQKQEGIF